MLWERRDLLTAQLADSHFWRFFQIYKQYPDDFFPARAVAQNPNTTSEPNPPPNDPVGLLQEQKVRVGRIEDTTTLAWGHLFNVRYRILLTYLAHYVALPPTGKDKAETTAIQQIRDQLLDWIFDEMNGRSLSSIKGLAIKLSDLPRGSDPEQKAGAPLSHLTLSCCQTLVPTGGGFTETSTRPPSR